MRVFLAVLGFLMMNASAQGQASLPERLKAMQGDPVALKTAVEAGKKASFFCANCHGEDAKICGGRAQGSVHARFDQGAQG